MRWTAAVALLFACGGTDRKVERSAAVLYPSGYSQTAAAWWGDPANPDPNHVVAVVDGVVPDATVSGTIGFYLTCSLPPPTTLAIGTIVMQVDGTNIRSIYKADAQAVLGTPVYFSIDTTLFSDGWHELRGRCYAYETTAGADYKHQTQVTNGHQLYFKNGKAIASSSHSIPGMVDDHSWYDTDVITGDTIGYVYVQIMNAHAFVDAPVAGTVSLTGKVSTSGATTVSHWMVKMDDTVLYEYHDSTQQRTVAIDTTLFANGQHTLKFHGHGLARSGKQLAGQVQIPIVISN